MRPRWKHCPSCSRTFGQDIPGFGMVPCPNCGADVWTGNRAGEERFTELGLIRSLLGPLGRVWDGRALVIPLPPGYFYRPGQRGARPL